MPIDPEEFRALLEERRRQLESAVAGVRADAEGRLRIEPAALLCIDCASRRERE